MTLMQIVRAVLLVPALTVGVGTLATTSFGKDDKAKKGAVKKAPAKKPAPAKKKDEPKKEEPKKEEAAAAAPAGEGTGCAKIAADAPAKEKQCKTEGNQEYDKCMKENNDDAICGGICEGDIEECMK